MRFWKCEFRQKWDFETVNFLKIEIFQMWFLDKMWIFAPVWMSEKIYDIFSSSLKTNENLEVVKSLPLESLQLETDAPWCEIRATHASATYVSKGQTWAQEYTTVKKPDKWVENCIVKGRNEPIFIQWVYDFLSQTGDNILFFSSHVLDVVSGVKNEPREKVAQIVYDNSFRMFFKGL